MANTFTLDDIRAAAEAKYGSTDIPVGESVVRLLNPLRLSKAKRDELIAVQDGLQADDADQEDILSQAIRLVAQTEAGAEALLAEVGGDLALLVTVFTMYTDGTQVGEASGSQE